MSAFLLLMGSVLAAPNLRVQGREHRVWNTINSGDRNPDQQVTDFGEVDIGLGGQRLYRLQNQGDETLVVTAIDIPSSEFRLYVRSEITDDDLPVRIEPGDKAEFTLSYRPTQSATTALVTIHSNDRNTGEPYKFAVTGRGKERNKPHIYGRGTNYFGNTSYEEIISPDNDEFSKRKGTDFGTLQLGDSATLRFKLANEGDSFINMSQLTISPAAEEFSVSGLHVLNPILGPLAGGNDRHFTVTWTPTAIGPMTARFNLRTNTHDDFIFNIGGRCIDGSDVRVTAVGNEGEERDIRNGDLNPIDDLTNFRQVDVGTERKQDFLIHNEGNEELQINSITSSNPEFTIEGVAGSVEPGGTDDFTIIYRPELPYTALATIEVTTNGPDDRNPYVFTVIGKSRDDTRPNFEVAGRSDDQSTYVAISDSSPPSTEEATLFGDLLIGDSVRHHYRVTNNASDHFSVSTSIDTGGSAFRVSDIDPVIAPGETFDFTVTFRPGNPGVLSARVSIKYFSVFNWRTETAFDFFVRGSGIGPSSDVSPLIPWRHQHFSPADLSNPLLESILWGDNADPDGDGQSNAAEAYHGSSPNSRDALGGPLDALGRDDSTDTFHIHWRRTVDTGGVTAIPKWSNDMVTWYASDEGPNAKTIETEVVATSADSVDLRATVKDASDELIFMKLVYVTNR